MKQRQVTYRAWDNSRKQMYQVRAVRFSPTNTIMSVDISLDGMNNIVTLEKDFMLMMSTGQQDATNHIIFEEDLVDFYMDHPRSGWIKVRGRVVWNDSITYGPIGFLILDETNSVHEFTALDNITVVGDMFTGVKK